MSPKIKIDNISRLAALSFVCFMVGLYLINEMVWGYGFLLVGFVLAVIDIVLKRKRDNNSQAHHH